MLEVQPTGQSGRTATGSGRNGRDRTTVIWSGPVHVVTISLHTPLMGSGPAYHMAHRFVPFPMTLDDLENHSPVTGLIICCSANISRGFNCATRCCLVWRRGAVVSGVRRMNRVNARRAQLVPGWVTVFGRVHHLGT